MFEIVGARRRGVVRVGAFGVVAALLAYGAWTSSTANPDAPAIPGTPANPGAPAIPGAPANPGAAVATDLGCAASMDAADLSAWLAKAAPTVRFDNAHVYPLGGEGYLWLVNDAYVDPTRAAPDLFTASYVNNLALRQEGPCFTMLHGGTATVPQEFEQGTLGDDPGQFFWPLGGTFVDGVLQVVWAQMLDEVPAPAPEDGIIRHPIATWLARYDPTTLARLEFRPMPNSGVFPQYGFAVETVGAWTYLFGNSNLLNFRYEGGFFGADHSATRMYLARVPRGQLGVWPEYWDGGAWSSDPTAAAPISERFALENQMQIRHLGDRWVAVTKQDGFVGEDVVVDVAAEPWGPWVEVGRHRVEPPPVGAAAVVPAGTERLVYHPFVLPFDPAGPSNSDRITVVASSVAVPWPHVEQEPELYEAFVVELAVPDYGAAGREVARPDGLDGPGGTVPEP